MKPNFTLFSDNLDYALGWMVIHSLWQATLIAFISGILMVVLRKKTAKLRYVVANIALLAVVISAVVTFCFYYDFANQPVQTSFTPTKVLTGAAAENIVIPTEVTTKSEESNPLSISGFKDYFNQNIPLIVTIWILGVAIFMLKLLGGISYIYYLKNRMNFPADEYWSEMLRKLSEKAVLQKGIDIVESAMVRTPMVVGHLKPLILFPMGIINRLAPEEVEAILAHELAHVMRKDFIFNILQSVVEALFYFHPAVWWLSSQIRNERESACDDMAIDLINSKVNYAKALVAIQEMAYFPLTPSLAFAGQRKSQFMMRMQRILNQPNNKTNIMEKLIATCSLLLLMVGLSFGGNKLTDTPSVSEPQFEEIDLNMYVYLPNLVDSLPVSSEVLDGVYKYEDNTQKAEITVKNNYVVALKVNDIVLKEEQFINYKRLIDKVLRTRQSISPNKVTNIPDVLVEPGTRITLDNLAQVVNLDKMGGADLDISESGDGGMIIKGKDGSRITVEHTSRGEQVVTTTDKKGNISKVITDKNGNTITENYEGNKLTNRGYITTSIDRQNTNINYSSGGENRSVTITGTGQNGVTTIESKQNGRIARTEVDGDVVTAYQTDGSKEVIDKDKDGYTRVRFYDKRGKNFDEFNVISGKAYKNGREVTDAELKALGWERNHMGIMRIGGMSNISTAGSTNTNAYSYNNSNDNDLEEQIQDLKNDVKELRKEIKECQCTTNFDFRMNLISKLDNTITLYLKNNISQSSFNDLEAKFLKIQNDWEKGECDDFKQNQNNNRGYYQNNNQNNNALDNRVKEINRRAKGLSAAIDDCDCKEKDPNWVKWAQVRLNAEYNLALNNKNDWGLKSIENEIDIIESQFNRLKKQRGNTNCEGCPPGNGQTYDSYNTTPNGYSYGTGNSYAQAEKARKDAERMSKNRGVSSNEDAIHVFFQTLLDGDYISFDKQCVVLFNQNNLNIDGRRIPNSEFERIKQNFERVLGQSTYALNYNGIIKGSNNNLSIQGALSTNFNNGGARAPRSSASSPSNYAKSNENSNSESRQSQAQRSIFLNLKNMGFIQTNKNCTIDVNQDRIKVDGKTIDEASFNRIKDEFERKLGKKSVALTIYFKGTIQNINEDHLEMSGKFSNSLSTED